MGLTVVSLEDPRVAPYRDLREGRLLEEQGVFVAESRHVVRRLLVGGRFRVRSLLVSEAALAELGP
ncbi:MAG: TrmH family RNA methyltransferase, partial [Myxococcota bacterium]